VAVYPLGDCSESGDLGGASRGAPLRLVHCGGRMGVSRRGKDGRQSVPEDDQAGMTTICGAGMDGYLLKRPQGWSRSDKLMLPCSQ